MFINNSHLRTVGIVSNSL